MSENQLARAHSDAANYLRVPIEQLDPISNLEHFNAIQGALREIVLYDSPPFMTGKEANP